MSRWIDAGAVSAALVLSIFYALSALGPKALRARLWRGLGAGLAHLPPALRCARLESRIATAAARMQAACGGCDSCDSPSAGDSAGEATPAGGKNEVRVPIAAVGRRELTRR